MTAEELLAVALAELGTKESPANSNNVKYNTWYYGRAVSGAAYPWCMAFVQWCFDRAGDLSLLPVLTASCGVLAGAARLAGQWVDGGFRPGDVVIYDFPGGGSTDHCGIVESVSGDTVTAIEGNTSEAGSQSNGGMVCRKTRKLTLVVGAVRPKFEEVKKMADNTPSTAYKEGVDWAVEKGILRGNAQGDLMLREPLTREQFCTMLKRYDDGRMNT